MLDEGEGEGYQAGTWELGGGLGGGRRGDGGVELVPGLAEVVVVVVHHTRHLLVLRSYTNNKPLTRPFDYMLETLLAQFWVVRLPSSHWLVVFLSLPLLLLLLGY